MRLGDAIDSLSGDSKQNGNLRDTNQVVAHDCTIEGY
jgi:hypothetical protein